MLIIGLVDDIMFKFLIVQIKATEPSEIQQRFDFRTLQ